MLYIEPTDHNLHKIIIINYKQPGDGSRGKISVNFIPLDQLGILIQ